MGPCEVSNRLFAQKLDDTPRWTMIRHGMTNHQAWSASRATTLLSGLMTSPRWTLQLDSFNVSGSLWVLQTLRVPRTSLPHLPLPLLSWPIISTWRRCDLASSARSQTILLKDQGQAHQMKVTCLPYGNDHGPVIDHLESDHQTAWMDDIKSVLNSFPTFAGKKQQNTEPLEVWSSMVRVG